MEDNARTTVESGELEETASKFSYPEGEEVLYRDPEGNLLTPDEFRTRLQREETDEEREVRYQYAREVQRRLLGDEVAGALERSSESSEDGSHRPPENA